MSGELLKQAIQMRTEQRFAEAERILQSLLAEDPANGIVAYHMAWLCDNQGREHEAISFYARALEGTLSGEDRRGAMLGLGSSYRCIGEYERSVEILDKATHEFEAHAEFVVFRALALRKLNRNDEAFAIILRQLALTTGDERLAKYKRALLECADEIKAGG
jgi:tetratricopeptide (TPR) repeat protein